MHPYMAQEIIRQHTADLRAQAQRDKDVRKARTARQKRDRVAAQADAVFIPPIPDYVDGTFHEAGEHAPVRA